MKRVNQKAKETTFQNEGDAQFPVPFSDASSHLYKRVCPIVAQSVYPSIRYQFRKISANGNSSLVNHRGYEVIHFGRI